MKKHSQEKTHNERQIDDFFETIAGKGNLSAIGKIVGLEKSDNESDTDFRKRAFQLIAEKSQVPINKLFGLSEIKTQEEWNRELINYLKNHFLNRLCWWSVSNNGDDFEIELTEPTNPLFPLIEIKIYPSGKPKEKGIIHAE